ncbi:MAG: hypothetical protein ABI580_05675 [Burkholderiaceae bacterium]
MTAAFIVICEDLCDCAFAGDLPTTLLFGERDAEFIGLTGRWNTSLSSGCTSKLVQGTGLTYANVEGRCERYCNYEFLHVSLVLNGMARRRLIP